MRSTVRSHARPGVAEQRGPVPVPASIIVAVQPMMIPTLPSVPLLKSAKADVVSSRV